MGALESYSDAKRPPLDEAIKMEFDDGVKTLNEVYDVLTKKGYFTPQPRPWSVGYHDRGLGRGDYAVIDKFGDLVVKVPNKETAEFIVLACNSFSES